MEKFNLRFWGEEWKGGEVLLLSLSLNRRRIQSWMKFVSWEKRRESSSLETEKEEVEEGSGKSEMYIKSRTDGGKKEEGETKMIIVITAPTKVLFAL